MYKFENRDAVGELVPHKGKMLLLDRVQEYSLEDISIKTEIDINDKVMFFKEELDGVPSYVAFEYMAQSISALSGIYGRQKGEQPREGFIMSVSNCKMLLPTFKNGVTVLVKVKQSMRVDMAVTFEGEAYIGDSLVVSASLCTVEVDDPKSILK